MRLEVRQPHGSRYKRHSLRHAISNHIQLNNRHQVIGHNSIPSMVMFTINLFHLTRSRRQGRVHATPIQSRATRHPLRFKELQNTPILTRMLRLLYIRRLIFMLTNHMLRRSKRNINIFIRRMPTCILEHILLLPSTRSRSINRKMFTLVRRYVIRDTSPTLHLLRRISTVKRANTRHIYRGSTGHTVFNRRISRTKTWAVNQFTLVVINRHLRR